MQIFQTESELDVERFDWGTVRWRCREQNTGSQTLVIMDVTLSAGQAHDFHRHPEQDEYVTIRSGRVLQYVEHESRELGPGDSVYLAANTPHATFNIGDTPAEVSVVIGPAKGPDSYEVVDVASEEPWASIRRPGGAV